MRHCLLYRILLLVFTAILISPVTPSIGFAGDNIRVQCDFPYYLGKAKDVVLPGETVQALVVVENCGREDRTVPVELELPGCFAPFGTYEGWQVVSGADKTVFSNSVDLSGGYSQWFDLLRFTVSPDAPPGSYQVRLTVNGQPRDFTVSIGSGGSGTERFLSVSGIVLPLDKDGRKDDRLNDNTLVLRDRQLDYYKNVLQGKGAANLEIEAIHPVSHMGIDFDNPGGQQKLVTITARLLDKTTRQPVEGLFTPGTTGEDKDAGSIGGHKDSLEVFTALTGEAKQRILLPVYADEQYAAGGTYWLQVVVDDGVNRPLVETVPLTIVKKNRQAMLTTCSAAAAVLVALLFGLGYLRRLLAKLKTRWLVTAALFGAAVFAMVNVPSTLLNDFFHVLLGPFGFLITGLFSSVFLYMLVVSLVVLIPRPGIISLMTLVRMLLGMLVFGNISPIGVLSYGVHALTLELLFYFCGVYGKIGAHGGQINFPARQVLAISLLCGVADSIAIYVGLQSMAFLYRMYYADWYIYLAMLINGLLYTAVGAACGLQLGCRLSRVGGD
ncbi:MAG: hypothetical protein ABFC84_12495 [Veillonellales bacterium]